MNITRLQKSKKVTWRRKIQQQVSTAAQEIKRKQQNTRQVGGVRQLCNTKHKKSLSLYHTNIYYLYQNFCTKRPKKL